MMEKVFISVILPLKLEWEPCYFISHENAGAIKIGTRVRVNFAGRSYIGVVSAVNIEPTADLAKIKEAFLDLAKMEPVLFEEIEFWRRISDYYMCSIGEVYRAAYPLGKTNLEESLALKKMREQERKQKQILNLENKICRFSQKISRLDEKIAAKERQIFRTIKIELKNKYISDKDVLISNKQKLIEEQESLSNSISLLKSTLHLAADAPMLNSGGEDSCVVLTSAQQVAYNQICHGFESGKPVLLHGVTGAGKTEIYLKLASESLAKGQNVLYLVPEIALSRQLEYRLKKHFHHNFYIFHSGQTAVQKRDIADNIRRISTNPYIVLGTRSALFLPHNNLGLIIVDEEHDSSYKQDSPAPRYNGRDSALILAQIHAETQKSCLGKATCNIVLGSATPSLEEVYNCNSGRHSLVKLTQRYHGADDSDIEIIDTKAERRKRGMVGSFSRKLIFKINTVLEEGGQVMILRSRRAWSTSMQCSECGEIVKCPHCNVSLSLHGRPENGRLVCHYCGYSRVFENKCDKCGSALVPMGTGTQRIEEEVIRLFPAARVARLDSDSVKDKSYEKQTIQDFSDGKVDILVGTQIVAKGFDFSNLRLVAVVAADALLSMQDFRADEKAMQLLEQFRGRCGRRKEKGFFVIQTSQPEHPIYQRLVQDETEYFTGGLMLERKEFGFPPFSRIIEIQIKDRVEERALSTASNLASLLRSQLACIYSNGLEVVTGPYTPIPDKIADNYLRTIRISLKKDKNLIKSKDVIRSVVHQFERQWESTIIINVDPV